MKWGNKYHNEKVLNEDGKFDSKYEYQEWCRLKVLERGKVISELRRQVPFDLIPTINTSAGTLSKIRYVADFVYKEGNRWCIYESKGYKTGEYNLKKRLLIYKYVINGDYVFIECSKNKKTIYQK